MRTRLLAVTPSSRSRHLEEAVRVLLGGGLVAFPTETVYGLGADATNPRAVGGIFAAKGRPGDNPLIVHVASLEEAQALGAFDDRARALAARFWPGPLTLVVEADPRIPEEVRAGLPSVAIRMPRHLLAQDLIRLAGVPVAAPSANRSGRPSPTDAASVREDLDGRIPLILDGGPAEVGVESTVVDVTGEKVVLLRPGGISSEDLERVCGPLGYPQGEDLLRRSPGTRHRHYAPGVPLWLWDGGDVPEEIRILEREGVPWGYVGVLPPPANPAWELRGGTFEEYAALLFRALRRLEQQGARGILAEWPRGKAGIARALRDRLSRASGGREPLVNEPERC